MTPLIVLGALLGFASLLGFANALFWPFDMFCHFRVQYVLGLAVVAIALALLQSHAAAVVLALLAIVNLLPIASLYRSNLPPVPERDSDYRLIQINVLDINRQYQRLRDLVEQYDPDLLVLEEVDAGWATALEGLGDRFPHFVQYPRTDRYGLSLFSKLPLEDAELLRLGDGGFPALQARIQTGDEEILVVVMHPPPPSIPRKQRIRNSQFRDIAARMANAKGPRILVGDLNSTPWSQAFGRLVRDSGLRDSEMGRGLQPTWPSGIFALRIPIDHCLYSKEIEISKRRVGPAVGSDHLPLIIDFRIADRAGTAAS